MTSKADSGRKPTLNIKLKKFDMRWISDDSVVVFIGKRNTGKTFLTLDLLYHHRDIPISTVISATEGANQTYSRHIPKMFIHKEYTPDLIAKVIQRQGLLQDKINHDPQYADVDPRSLLLLDDCMFDNTWTKDRNIRSCFMNGRHFKLFFILTMQYMLGIPPSLRSNIDYVFILRENQYSMRKRLYEQFCGMFRTFDIFCQVMDACTENYECLVVHNGAKSNKLEDQVFWYKAEPHPDFKMCLDCFWNSQAAPGTQWAVNGDEEDDDHGYDRKKNAVAVQVRKI